MYLSRLILNPRSRHVRRDLANCHDLHRTLLSAFPDLPGDSANAREQLGVLYRIEPDDRAGSIRVLVQSQARPDWSLLADNYLHPSDPFSGDESQSCKEIDNSLRAVTDGMELVFRLRANPTRRVGNCRNPNDPLKKKRVELQTEDEWNTWVQRKGVLCGFEVLNVHTQADAAGQERFRKIYGDAPPERDDVPDVRSAPGLKVTGSKERGTRPMTFGSVLFEGRLRVIDAEAFRQALASGIGSGKAYGFGLLSIALPRS